MEKCQELCKVEQPDALQHNGMTNSVTEKCYLRKEVFVRSTWKLLLPLRWEAQHTKSGSSG